MSYLRYAARKGIAHSGRWLLLSFVLFVLAVLSKSTAVAFPLVLFVLDWLVGRRGWGLVREKIPFLTVSAGVAALSLAMAPHDRAASPGGIQALLFPFHSFSFILQKTLAPVHLSPIYARPGLAPMIAGLITVTVITVVTALLARRGHKAPLAAWAIYLLQLTPNLFGLSSGMQPVADRYSYLATIPIYLLVGSAITVAWERWGTKRRVAIAACGAVVALVLISRTLPQSSRWRSSISLWEYVVAQFPAKPDYVDAYVNLGTAYDQAGRRAEARALLDKAAAVDSTNTKVLYNLGILSYLEGDRVNALRRLRRVTTLDPRNADAFYNRALVADQLGLNDEGIAAMVEAARLGMRDAQEALTSRGLRW